MKKPVKHPVKHTAAHAFAEVPGSERVALPGAKALGVVNPHTTIEVLLKLRRKKELPDIGSRPAKPMTREELASEYGGSAQDMSKVEQTMQGFGLKVVSTDPATRSVRMSGTAAQIEAAFQVKLFDYSHSGEHYRGRVGAVHVPAELQGIVQGVFGLDDRRTARRGRRPSRAPSTMKSISAAPKSWYLPSELATHYKFPPGDGSGQAVGVLEFGGGYFESDLSQFCKAANIGLPKVVPISADGTAANAKDGAEGEVMLDVEVVAGACPKATIAVYFAHFSEKGWLTILDKALQDKDNNPRVLSVSWGFAEKASTWTGAAMTQVNEALKEAAMLGVTVCVAAGDDGSSDAILDGHAHVDFPSSSPYALAVGGTTIPVKGGAQPDVVWFEGDGLRDDNGGSTGGGMSAVFPRPAWQQEINIQPVNPGAIVGRCVPDLAANADWNASPYLLVVDGSAQPNGGTSAATPLVAALIARINQQRDAANPVGYLTPLLYQAMPGAKATIGAAGCTDIVSGSNTTAKVGGFSAGEGYDACSGWGTPDGVALAQALAKAAPGRQPSAPAVAA